MKRRILFSGEASWLSTGFATYNREILKLLHATGKYEIAELGGYGRQDDPNAQKLPWKFYGVMPLNEEEERIYKSNPQNQFGAYKFDAVVADFQPDIVFDARDPWMLTHILKSRFRANYKTILMPTVDSHPQKAEWIEELFKKSDKITTYSVYAKEVLELAGVKVDAVTSPGVDLEVFKPLNKEQIRSDWGIKKGLLVIGTVMRNQKRKLFPDLFESYMAMLKKYENIPEIKRSVLLCHTSYPDLGWDLRELLHRTGVLRHTIFTYHCDSCTRNFFSWFLECDPRGNGRCLFCGKQTAHMPNTHNGISEKELAEIYNIMDIYIQPSICEGWALPIVEAKACGVPGLYQNYSAMEDHVKNGGGLPIKIGRYFTEAETMAVRSLPDHADMIDKMKFLLTNHKERLKMGAEARKCVEEMHGWSVSSKKLEKLIDETPIHDRADTWNARPLIKIVSKGRMPDGLADDQFVLLLYRAILDREPDQQGFQHWLTQLANGMSRDSVEAYFRNEVESHNRFEQVRFKKSLLNRGLGTESNITVESNTLPGILIA